MATVSVVNVSKRYQQTAALERVSIEFQDGEFFGLLGPSGSGKTTLLRCIAGFIEPDTGAIRFDGEEVEHIPVHQRRIGMVFQHYALFPHLSVYDNIAFGLAVRGVETAEIRQRVMDMLNLVRLAGYEARKPRELSGGQQQRVALARALVTRPRVLLLDEPLGALDRRLRQEMQIELRDIQRELGLTTIFVTHDQEEALTLSDRIAILDRGKIVQIGTPGAVYERPRNVFAANFLGDANIFSGTVAGQSRVRVTGHPDLFSADPLPAEGNPVTLAVRPEKIALAAADATPPERLINRLRGTVIQRVYSSNSTALSYPSPMASACPSLRPRIATATVSPLGRRCSRLGPRRTASSSSPDRHHGIASRPRCECVHVAIDMQRLLLKPRPGTRRRWPRCPIYLPRSMNSFAEQNPVHPFIHRTPTEAHGAWRHYFQHWRSVALDTLDPALLALVEPLSRLAPPAGDRRNRLFRVYRARIPPRRWPNGAWIRSS
ncbi:MAG: ABC transporter ATP-binding protein [Gammaproteobacteria bacterium]